MNDLRGSLWRKWDLHVHTPDSLVQDYGGVKPWDRFITELEQLPPEFKVIGINDYLFLEGYKKILAEKASGRLKNIDLFLPVIELRIDKFGGSPNHLSRVNYHIIFSDQLSPDIIEQQFLNALSRHYVLSPQYDYIRQQKKWAALPTKQSLIDLGNLIIDSVPDTERAKFSSPLIEGFNNLCINLEAIHGALNSSHYFDDKYVTAVGKTEWTAIKWNDQSIAEKKTIINGADFVFISSETVEDCKKAKQSLREGRVNSLLLDCSDAHRFKDAAYKDRIGKCFTWIKADPTFEGLRQVLNEPEDRVFIGDIPPKLTHVNINKTKYIHAITIERKQGAVFSEKWFNNTIPFNSDLIAIIGNKGKGKSALTDTIGLLCNTKQFAELTFLSDKNFRQPKDNKAKYFQAILIWESGVKNKKGLEESVDSQQPELAKYIPQNFLEKICTQLGRIEESDFDRELKKVIFSHVDEAQRLSKTSLDDLISYKTSEATAKIHILKQELSGLCNELVLLENWSTSEYRQKLDNAYKIKKQELDVHEESIPPVVPKPENDPVKQKEISEVSVAIENAKKEVDGLDSKIFKATEKRSQYAVNLVTIDKLVARLENVERQVQIFVSESVEDLRSIGLKVDEILKVSIEKDPLLNKRGDLVALKSALDEELNPAIEGSLIHQKTRILERINELQSKLDEPNKKYQAYQTALLEWEKKKQLIIGSDDALESVKYFEKRLRQLDEVPQRLVESRQKCLNKGKEIYAVIGQLAVAYRELYAPVNQFIESRSLLTPV